MRIAICDKPLKSEHNTRGIGTYTKNLIDSLKEQTNLSLTEFSSQVPDGIDIVHYPFFDFYFHSLPIRKKQRSIVTIHDVIPLKFPDKFPSGVKGKFNLLLQKLALKNVAAIICDSETSKADIVEKLHFPQEKIFVIYLASSPAFKFISDKKKLAHVADKYKLPDEFVLFVGDVNWNKNVSNLIKAIAINKKNLVLVGKAFVNEQLPQVKDLNKIISSLNLEHKVYKLGYIPQSDLVAIYNLAKLTILPSYYEGFGLPVLESMACGTPVICSNNSSLLEIGKSMAVYCNPDDPLDISSKISLVLKKNKIDSKDLIKYASRFTWEKVAKETMKVYRDTFEGR